MISVGTFEKAIQAALDNNRAELIKILSEASEAAKQRNQKNIHARLKELARGITPQKSYGPQSTSSYVVTSKSNPLYEKYQPAVLIDDVILADSERFIISQLLNEWEHKEELAANGLQPNNRLLLYGPPGTGKTMLAQAIATYLDMEIVYVRLDELISSYLGKTGKNIREIFDLSLSQDVVIFLDEIDTVAKQRNDEQELGELKRIVTVLLQNIDMLSPGSVLIGATNHAELLDGAFWRRFPSKLELSLPEKNQRSKMIKSFLGDGYQKKGLSTLVELTNGISGSDIKEIATTAKRLSIIKSMPLDEIFVVSIFTSELFKIKNDRKTRKNIYSTLSRYLAPKYDLTKMSKVSGIPYTTLRDNIHIPEKA